MTPVFGFNFNSCFDSEKRKEYRTRWNVFQKFSDFYLTHLKLKSNPYLINAARKGRLGARKLLKLVLFQDKDEVSVPIDLEPFIKYLKCMVLQIDPEDYGLPYLGCTISVRELSEVKLIKSVLGDFARQNSSCDYIVVVKPEELIGRERQRFVIAHELGHVFFRHIEARSRMKNVIKFSKLLSLSGPSEFISELVKQKNIIEARQEVIANAFAGELLVPETVLKSFLFDRKINSISRLSRIFMVSEPVVFIQACFISSEHLLTP